MAGSSHLLKVSQRNSDWKSNLKCCWFVMAFACCCFLFKRALRSNLTSASVKTLRFFFCKFYFPACRSSISDFSFQPTLASPPCKITRCRVSCIATSQSCVLIYSKLVFFCLFFVFGKIYLVKHRKFQWRHNMECLTQICCRWRRWLGCSGNLMPWIAAQSLAREVSSRSPHPFIRIKYL